MLLSVPEGRFGLIGDREIYINLDEEGLAAILEDEPGLDGLIADELGDDLTGAGVIFDLDAVRIEARIPRQVAHADLFGQEGSLIGGATSYDSQWEGAEIAAIDAWGVLGWNGDDRPDI